MPCEVDGEEEADNQAQTFKIPIITDIARLVHNLDQSKMRRTRRNLGMAGASSSATKEPEKDEDDHENGDDKDEISLLDWFQLNENMIAATADVLKDEIGTLRANKIEKNEKFLRNEKRSEAVKLSKIIVTGFHDAISKAIKDLQELQSNMTYELQKRYNLPEDWAPGTTGSVYTSVAGSDVLVPTSRLMKEKEMERRRLDLMFNNNDCSNLSDASVPGKSQSDHGQQSRSDRTECQDHHESVSENEGRRKEIKISPKKSEATTVVLTSTDKKPETNKKSSHEGPSEITESELKGTKESSPGDDVDMIPASDDENEQAEETERVGEAVSDLEGSKTTAADTENHPEVDDEAVADSEGKKTSTPDQSTTTSKEQNGEIAKDSEDNSDYDSDCSNKTLPIKGVAKKETLKIDADPVKVKKEKAGVGSEKHSGMRTPEKRVSSTQASPRSGGSRKSSAKSRSPSESPTKRVMRELEELEKESSDSESKTAKTNDVEATLSIGADESGELMDVLTPPSPATPADVSMGDDDFMIEIGPITMGEVKVDKTPPQSPGETEESKALSPASSDKENKRAKTEAGGDQNKKDSKTDTKSKLSRRRSEGKSEREALRDVLGSDSEDDLFKPKKVGSSERSRRKTAKNLDNDINAASSSAGASNQAKDDPKLKYETTVNIEELSPTIIRKLEEEKYVLLKGFGKMQKKGVKALSENSSSTDDSDEQYDSDDTIKKLKKALKKLSRNSIITSANYDKKRGVQQTKKGQKKGKGRSNKCNDQSDELLSDESDDEDAVKIRSEKYEPKMDKEIKSDSGSEDLDNVEDSDSGKKKTRSQSQKKSEKSGRKKKTYKSLSLSSSDSEKADKRDILGSDTDDENEISTKTLRSRKKKVGSESDSSVKKKSSRGRSKAEVVELSSDSDFVSFNRNKKKKKRPSTDSESASVKSVSESDSSDSDFIKSKKRRRKGGSSESDDKSKKRKKRRRIVNPSDESEKKSNDSDIEEVPVDDENEPGSSQKGRKNIRKIMSTKHLTKSTREAEREEDERKRRLAEKQKLFNGIHKAPETDRLERLILDIDPETKEPVIEVDESIVKKLKPHQAEGIKFMYNACFESVEMIKEDKVPGGCILAHCMGLGKTLQTVALVHTLLTSEICKVKTCLIICPLSTVANWYNEFRQWTEDAAHVNLHKIWEAKTSADSRIGYLRAWHKRGGVGIMHYEMFVRMADPKKKNKIKERLRNTIEETLLDPGPDIVVCDEGHLLKNWKSQRSLAVNQIRTRRRIVLTGTPLQNNLVEYHTMMNFVKPNLLGTLNEFTNRFVNPIQNGQHADSTEGDVRTMKRRAHVLHRKLEGCVQRRDYSILAPYLPPKYEYIINIKLSEKQEQLYKYYLEKVVDSNPDAKRRMLLKYYAELVKVWSHPIALTMRKESEEGTDSETDSMKDFIVNSDEDDDIQEIVESGEGSNDSVKQKTASTRRTRSKGIDPDAPTDFSEAFTNKWWSAIFKSKEEMYDVALSGKLVILQEILKICENIGDKVLVFSQFLTSLDIIEEFLADWDKEAVEKERADKSLVTFPLSEAMNTGRWRKNVEYFRIDGGVKQSDRQRDCDKFNKKSTLSRAKLFLISTKAGGLGINLYGANRVVIFDASWNPSQDMQSIFRIYRFGQDKPCYIYRLIAHGTMEQKILRRQITKLSLSSRVVDEHQIQRHFKFDDVNAMYTYDGDEEEPSTSSMAVPKDKLFADLILSHGSWIRGYEQFDSLLENRPDEGLTKEEKEEAWAEYKVESDRQKQFGGQNSRDRNMEIQTYMKVRGRLITAYPTASEDQIETATTTAIQVIDRIRSLMLVQNKLPEARRGEMDPLMNPLKTWLQEAVQSTDPRPVPPEPEPLLQALPAEFYMAMPRVANFYPVQSNIRPPAARYRAPAPYTLQYMQQQQNLNYIQNQFAQAMSNVQGTGQIPQLIPAQRMPMPMPNVNGAHGRDPLS